MIEEQLRGLLDRDVKVMGRLDGTVPRDGELNPVIVARALGMKTIPRQGGSFDCQAASAVILQGLQPC
ncbi:MAG: hypothetical protein MZV63_00265 [Marinilabiliales bacterium]|nr:hypothetical protein [Marinilabiliales bacterium]